MIKNFLLQLSIPGWLFAILAVVLAGIAYAFYFRTLPPLSAIRRYFSIFLRAVTLIIMFFLLLEPVLRLINRSNEKPVIGVLFDNSASMKISDAYGERGDSLKFVERYIRQLANTDTFDFRSFKFDLTTRRLQNDTLSFEVDGSNITQAITAALDSLSGANLQALVLVSDGIYNQGVNPLIPAKTFKVPVHTVLVGDTTLPKDIALRRVQTNQITYVKNKLPVEVTFWQNGYAGQKAVIKITHGKQLLAQRTVTLGKSGFEQKAVLEIVPDRPGDFNYTVSVQPLQAEITRQNNRQTVRVQVLKSKLKVLVISGSPSFDRQAISFAARQLEDFDFTFLTEKSTGQYFENRFNEAVLDSQDLFILQGFPTSNSSTKHLQAIFRQVRTRKVPIFWMISDRANYQKLSNFRDLIPFDLPNRLNAEENQLVQLTTGGRLHPVLQLDENESANELLWQGLPPVICFRPITPKNGSQLLLQSTAQNGTARSFLPVAFAYRQNEIKHLVLNAANFNSWHYQLQEDLSRDRFLIRFLERAVRWLANRDDIQQVQIKPLQSIYNVGEQVVFSGKVYDEFYNPVNDAQVQMTVTKDSTQISDEVVAEGNGFYRQTLSGLPQGNFNYRIEAKRDEQLLGVRTGRFTVKPFFIEFQQIPANRALMQQLSLATTGKFYVPGEFVKKFPERKFVSRVQFTFSEFFLWSYWYWLVLLILLLSIEWFLRKRWGLL